MYRITEKDVDTLIGVFEALTGAVSETGPEYFDAFYPGGGEKMMDDFQDALVRIGVKVVQ